jgi:hypothetical protein
MGKRKRTATIRLTAKNAAQVRAALKAMGKKSDAAIRRIGAATGRAARLGKAKKR